MTRRRAAIVASGAIVLLLSAVGALLRDSPAPSQAAHAPDKEPLAPTVPTEPVRGRVVDGAGRPIASATVRCDRTAVQTDATGVFRCPLWDDGRHTLLAYAAGYVDVRVTGGGAISVDLDPNPRTGASESRGPWVLTLRRPIRLSGHVVHLGRPVAGARMSISYLVARGLQRDLPPFQLPNRATTDARGAFQMSGLPPGRFRLRAATSDGAMGRSSPMDLGDGERRDGLVIRLRASASVAFHVRSTVSGDLPAHITLRPARGGAGLETTCDAHGRARLDGVPPGEWQLSVTAPGHYPATPETLTLRPHDAKSRELMLLPLSGIVGSVRDGAGKAVAAAAVVLSCPEGRKVLTSTGDGSFRWASPKRPCDVTAVHPAYANAADVRAVPGQPATLTLGLGGSIRGKVVAGDNAAVGSALIHVDRRSVRGEDPLGAPTLQPAHSQPDGSFRVGPLRPGTYELRASAPNHPPSGVIKVVVQAARTAAGVTLRLDAGAMLSGTVRGAGGGPISGARVELRGGTTAPAAGAWQHTTRSDATGHYRLGPAPGGRYLLLATSEAGLPARVADFLVPERGDVSRDLDLRSVAQAAQRAVPAIGAWLRETPGGLIIAQVNPGGPAATAGIQVGQQVVSVDFQRATDLGIGGAVKALAGASVQVTVEVRGADGHAHTVYINPKP